MDAYFTRLNSLCNRYDTSQNISVLIEDLEHFSKTYGSYFGVGDHLIVISEELFARGDHAGAVAFLMAAHKHCQEIGNKATLYLRLAQFCLEQSDTEPGINYLIKLCTETVDNYEEAIEFNGLTEIWLKYKHLVEGRVPPSVSVNTAPAPLPPKKCSMDIKVIFALPENEILSALSEHLSELSADGEAIRSLNQWEKTVFYADKLCMELDSGGFSHYLYYYGNHFSKAYRAWETIHAEDMTELLDRVQNKFPGGKLPRSHERMQNVLISMEHNGTDFELEDNVYYEQIERAAIAKLTKYVLENKRHFR